MKLFSILSTVLILIVSLGELGAAPPPVEPADTIYRNGAVYTVDAVRSWAEAVAVRRGRIVYVGSNRGLEPLIGRDTRVLDLQGKMVLPGFHDSHVHLVGGGIEMAECDLNGMWEIEPILAALKQYAERNPKLPVIRGGGWPLTLNDGNPRRETLDKIVPDRPVLLDAFDGHSSWANTKALQLAGITKDTPDPPRGRIERDPKTGEPTGTLREAATKLVNDKFPKYTDDDYLAGLRRGVQLANRLGITSIQEAAVRDYHLKAFAALDQADELTVRTIGALRIDPAQKQSTQVAQFVEWRDRYRGKRFKAAAVKIFLDGVIESKTAALLEPYDGGDVRGWLNLEPEVLKPLAAELDRLGFQIHIHAIGDRAIQTAFDALEFAQGRNGVRDSRHHMAHIQLFAPADIPRFRRLGVIANFQPLWACADDYIVKMTEPVLGPERSRWLYPIRSVAETGAIIAGGSDWSVSSMNPLDAIQIAVTRRKLNAGPGPGWIPEELVDLPLMIAAYTINGAYVNFEEQETGSIEVGKAADLIVLDRNLFEIPKHEIHQAKVLLTVLEGKEVHRHEDLK
ncbi:MAG: amidohydrolase [Planctomycetes bacterium]|nr:amidohydrolase [Planctomycetota bacterium]